MNADHALFWFALLGSTFSYFIYPAILLLLPKRRVELPDVVDADPPPLTIVITVHNEASRIVEKLENTLEVDYPADRLEIVVASDMSDDGTDELVAGFADRGVRLVRADRRLGKEYAQSLAIREAGGEIIVFSDVATRIPPGAIATMAADFHDPRVGAVSSEDRFVSADGRLVGEGAYVRYEMWLRGLESRVHGLVGLSGSFFAARRSVCEDWDIQVPSDFNTALNCARQGLVAISDPRVHGIYRDVADQKKEYRRKLRTIVRGWAALTRKAEVLNPFRFGLFSFMVWGHKVMRWLVPWFMLLLLFATYRVKDGHDLFTAFWYLQLAFFLAVAMAAILPALRETVVFRIPYYFVQVNLAIAHATLLFLMGHRVTVWEPSKR